MRPLNSTWTPHISKVVVWDGAFSVFIGYPLADFVHLLDAFDPDSPDFVIAVLPRWEASTLR